MHGKSHMIDIEAPAQESLLHPGKNVESTFRENPRATHSLADSNWLSSELNKM